MYVEFNNPIKLTIDEGDQSQEYYIKYIGILYSGFLKHEVAFLYDKDFKHEISLFKNSEIIENFLLVSEITLLKDRHNIRSVDRTEISYDWFKRIYG